MRFGTLHGASSLRARSVIIAPFGASVVPEARQSITYASDLVFVPNLLLAACLAPRRGEGEGRSPSCFSRRLQVKGLKGGQ
jgi:hypothetical protein